MDAVVATAITALSALVGAAASILTNAPRRSRLLKDIAIYEEIFRIGIFEAEKPNMVALRASISTQLDRLTMPYRRNYIMYSVTVFIIAASLSFCLGGVVARDMQLGTVGLFALAVVVFVTGVALGRIPGVLVNRQIDSTYKSLERLKGPNGNADEEAEDGRAENPDKGEGTAER